MLINPVTSALDLALYSPETGDGTLDTPEARREMEKNEQVREQQKFHDDFMSRVPQKPLVTPTARAKFALEQRGTQAEQWQDFLGGMPKPFRDFTERLGKRPNMPTQEEIDAQNSARQAGRTLKEGAGGQTAAGIRRMQAGPPSDTRSALGLKDIPDPYDQMLRAGTKGVYTPSNDPYDQMLRAGTKGVSVPSGLSEARMRWGADELLRRGRKESTPRQVLERRGFSPLEQDFIAGDGSRPADIHYKEDADAGTTRYEIPGTTGFAEFQGQRKGGGSFSVMPGLSAADKKRYAELKARDQREADRREYRDFANEVLSQYGDYPAVAMEILKQAEASMQTRASTEQAGLQAARESQQAQRTAQEERRRWEAENNRENTELAMSAAEQDRRWARDIMNDIPEMNDEEAFGILENFMDKDATGKPLPFQEKEFQETFDILPLTKDTKITVGQLYFNAAKGRYEMATPEGLQPLGGHADVLRYRHEQMRNRQLRRLGQ